MDDVDRSTSHFQESATANSSRQRKTVHFQKTTTISMTARQAILKTAQPSHYLVQFEIDECVGIVPRRHLLEPPIPSINDVCRVRWSGEEFTASILAMGEEATMRKAEKDFLESIKESENKPAIKKPHNPPKRSAPAAETANQPSRKKA